MIAWLKRNISEIVGGIVCLALVIVFPATAEASPSATPGIGNFAGGIVNCRTARGPIPWVEVSGAFRGREPAYVMVNTEPGWPLLYSYTVRVNGEVKYNLAISADMPKSVFSTPYYWIPAWDGVPGHEPQLDIMVSNPQPAQPVVISMQWASGDGYGRVVTAWAYEAECLRTGNPIPDRPGTQPGG